MYLETFPLLKELNIVSIALRIFLALILGGLLGIEREQKHRPAGFRTYIVVCLGATLASITNMYMFQCTGAGDPARIPAQVISGIGFLGAGTILVTKNNHIKGLTTAAGLWCSATIGIALGCGFYSGAILCSLIIVFSLRILALVDRRFDRYSKYINIYAEFSDPHFSGELLKYCSDKSYELMDLDLFPTKTPYGDKVTGVATFTIEADNPKKCGDILNDLQNLSGIVLVQRLK